LRFELNLVITTQQFSIKGAMCDVSEDLLTEMQYKIHNYVFSGV